MPRYQSLDISRRGKFRLEDGKLHARLNVIHEAGLFQGRLGFNKAIILLEEGCEEFSNIHGLGHIPFPKTISELGSKTSVIF
jgi:predicted nucleotide-binding protein